MQNGQVVDLQQLQQKTLYVLGIAGIIFAIVGILAALVLSRYIVYPINKLIESAEKITEEDKNIAVIIPTIANKIPDIPKHHIVLF